MDAWDGYNAEREAIFATARENKQNLVVLAGDTHNAWASNLKDKQGDIVGVEFATPSISSPGLESYIGVKPQDYQATEAEYLKMIDDLVYVNMSDRGYMTVTFTPEKVSSSWHFVSTTSTTNYAENTDRFMQLASIANKPTLVKV